jgi:hypothetical protein
MGEEAVVALFKLLFWHFAERNEENHESVGQDSRSPGHDIKSGPP